MSERTYGPELQKALLAAQASVQAALKAKRNTHHDFMYATAEEVILVARDALHAQELSLAVVRIVYVPSADLGGGASGKTEITFELTHAPTGQFRQFVNDEPVVPQPSPRGGWIRPLDKAIYATRTEAISYFLRDLLLIPRKDAPNVSGRNDAGGGAYRAPEQPAPAQAPPKAQAPAPRAPAPTATPITMADAVVKIGAEPDLEAVITAVHGGREGAKGTAAEGVIEEAFGSRLMLELTKCRTGEEVEGVAAAATRAKVRGPAQASFRQALQEARARFAPPGDQP